MSRLECFAGQRPGQPLLSTADGVVIEQTLREAGIRFERWPTRALPVAATPEQVLETYREEVAHWLEGEGYQTVDVVAMTPDHPKRVELRQSFLREHTHSEDEIRFFAAGQGLFALRIGDRVLEVLCTRGDLIAVPAGTPHWFDMGPSPDFVALRFFNDSRGWIAHYTGSDIADHFSRLEPS